MESAQIFFLSPESIILPRSKREIELEQSRRRSHAARISHRVRRRKPPSIQKNPQTRRRSTAEQDQDQKLPNTNPSTRHVISVRNLAPYPGDTASEARSFAFFRERTAVEWSGWEDAEFWTKFIPQVSFVSSALRHALIGLAACHESFEASNPDNKESFQQMGIAQGQMALKCLNREYANSSTSAILAAYIGISAFAARLHPGAYASTISVQYDFYNQLKTSGAGSLDEAYIQRYLKPIIERQSSRCAHFLDLSWNLAQTPAECFKQPMSVSVPSVVSSFKHARDVLEAILRLATYEIKLSGCKGQKISPATDHMLRQWYEVLQALGDTEKLSEQSRQSINILRAYARINVVMIQTMYADSETVFDEYLDTYKELANVFEEFIHHERKYRRMAVNFGADGCFITLIGHTAARLCRDPGIRQKLIRLLHESNRAEGFETAETWAMVAEKVQEIEETGIFPPPTSCHEIPAENRVRMVRALLYFGPSFLQIRYVRPDSQNPEAEEACFVQDEHGPCHLTASYPLGEQQNSLQPDLDVGKDYFSWVDKRTNTYRTMRGSNFYFPLPRC